MSIPRTEYRTCAECHEVFKIVSYKEGNTQRNAYFVCPGCRDKSPKRKPPRPAVEVKKTRFLPKDGYTSYIPDTGEVRLPSKPLQE